MAKTSKGKGGAAAKQTSNRQRAMAASAQKRKRGSIKEYFNGVQLELKKVV